MSDPRTSKRTVEDRVQYLMEHLPYLHPTGGIATFRQLLEAQFRELLEDQRETCASEVRSIHQFNKTGEPVCYIEEAAMAVLAAKIA